MSALLDVEKTTEIAGVFVEYYRRHHLRDIRIQECVNFLYVADKYTYRDRANTLTGDALFIFPSGPCLLNVMHILRTPVQDRLAQYWNNCIELSIYRTLRLKNTTEARKIMDERSHISRSDIQTVTQVWNEFKDMQTTDWPAYFLDTSTCPELVRPRLSDGMIRPSDIMLQYGYSDAKIAAAESDILCRAETYAEFAALLSGRVSEKL